MAILLGDVLKVASILSWNQAIDIVNVWHFKVTLFVSGPTPAQIKAAMETWLNGVFDNLKTHLAVGADPVTIKGDKVTWDPGTAKEVILENLFLDAWDMSTSAPAGTGETLPTQCAAVVTLRTLRPKSRGRKFFGPMVELASGDGGSLIPTLQTNLAAAAAAMLANAVDAEGNEYTPGILSPYAGGDYHYAFTTATFNNRFCTMRSRRFGVGE
jgi:hypothetical protein